MNGPVLIEDYTITHEGYYVESVKIIQLDSADHPCGWKYSLHYGTQDGDTLLRYDNAHERTKGHERHTKEAVRIIDFPGMIELYNRFQVEIKELPPQP